MITVVEPRYIEDDKHPLVILFRFIKWGFYLTLTSVAVFLVGASVYYSFIEGMFSDSVYYSNHSSHKKAKDLELVFLVDNLEYINPPELNDMYYNLDATNIIAHKKLPGYVSRSSEGIEYKDKDGVIYTFDRNNFEFLSAYQEDVAGKYIDVTSSVTESKVKEEMYRVVQPVLDWARNKQPNPNVQWIFDWYYHDRFN